MAKYLKLAGESWRLPAETDLLDLEQRIAAAIENRGAVSVPVEFADDSRQGGTLVLNCLALRSVALIETEEPS